jgi:ribonuclease Z
LFEVIFLGTSASAPSIHRGLSAQVVSYRDQRFLIDCGEGTQRQILRSGIGFRRLNRILITHGHLDHILGLAGLLSTFARWEAIDDLEIWAGRWALERIHDLLFGVVLRGAKPPMRIELVPIETGPILTEGDLRLSAFPVTHRGPGCFGFLFEESSRRPFLPERAEAFGLPAGPIRRELVQGHPVRLPDGRTIDRMTSRRSRLDHSSMGLRSPDDLVEIAAAWMVIIEVTYLEVGSRWPTVRPHRSPGRRPRAPGRRGPPLPDSYPALCETEV